MCSLAWAGCVVVSEPSVELAGTTQAAQSSSSGVPETTGAEPGSSSSESDSGEAPPIAAPDFEILWAVSPSEVMPPAASAGSIRTDVTMIPSVSYGVYPGGVDPAVLHAEIAAGIEAAIPQPDAEGFGVLPRPNWAPAWCGSTADAQDGFAASEVGQGLSGSELEEAFEGAALELLSEVLTRARAARPSMKWAIRGVPRPEYWKIVERDEDAQYEPWRTCNVASPAARELWDAVDFTAPELRYYYPVGVNGDYNDSYLARWIEAMRLADKPVYPLFTGRFIDSGTPNAPMPSYVGLPYYPDDVALVLTQLHDAGANGLIYDLEVEGCWDFENDGCPSGTPEGVDPREAFEAYWMSAFSPVLATLDEM